MFTFQPRRSSRKMLIQIKSRMQERKLMQSSQPSAMTTTRTSPTMTRSPTIPAIRKRRSASEERRRAALVRALVSAHCRPRLDLTTVRPVLQRFPSSSSSKTESIPREKSKSTRWTSELPKIASPAKRKRRSTPPTVKFTMKCA